MKLKIGFLCVIIAMLAGSFVILDSDLAYSDGVTSGTATASTVWYYPSTGASADRFWQVNVLCAGDGSGYVRRDFTVFGEIDTIAYNSSSADEATLVSAEDTDIDVYTIDDIDIFDSQGTDLTSTTAALFPAYVTVRSSGSATYGTDTALGFGFPMGGVLTLGIDGMGTTASCMIRLTGKGSVHF